MGKNPAQKAKEIEAKKKVGTKVDSREAKPKKKKVVTAPAGAPAEKSCKIKACKREYRAKGYCNTHYKKWKRGEYGIARYKTCSDFECARPKATNRHGYCEEHFQNYYVKGMEVHKAPAPAAAAPAKEEKKPAAPAAANG